MARIVFGAALSHSPLLALDWTEWRRRAETDLANQQLNLSDGSFVSYEELADMTGSPWAELATEVEFKAIAHRCQEGLNRIADALDAADPDIVMIIGDDQGELFSLSNMPAISVYYGDEIATNDIWGRSDKPDWMRQLAVGYAMDEVRRFSAAPLMARDLIEGLLDRHVDIGAASAVEDPVQAGFGHAFGFIIKRLFRTRSYPVLPILLNTYFLPNRMRAQRAYDVGLHIREALAASPIDARTAVIASGGLSHFIVDEELDRQVLAGLEPGRQDLLTSIPPGALNSGSSEILNWIMAAAASSHLPLSWTEYEPVRRTAAGTGIGIGIACWGASDR